VFGVEYRDRVVWITGASGGIGAALARRLAREGASLALTARRADALERVAASLPAGTRVLTVPGDVTDLDAIPGWLGRIEAELGPVDVLVANAGISQRSHVRDTPLAIYRELMEVDFFAPVALARSVLPGMLARGAGHIVVTSSVAGKYGTPLRSGYCAAKFALHGFFDSLRAETSKDGIAVSLLVAGPIQTDVSVNALTADGSKYGVMDALQATGIPVDVAADRIVAGMLAREPEIVIAEGPSFDALALARTDPKALFALVAER
jgi:dehydrogenase/reductase SDR family protein 7